MFGLDTIFILGYAVLAGAAAVGNRNGDRNNNYQHHEQLYTTYRPTPAPPNHSSPSSSSNSSSIHTTHSYFEKRTIYDWWCNGLDSEERQILLENGFSDRSGCFSLEELKSTSERMFAEKAPGKPTEKDGFKPNKKQGDKLVKNPNGKGNGWLDKNGEVWVPTGKGGDNPEGRPHGGPHWDVQNPRTGGHRNVYKGGGTR